MSGTRDTLSAIRLNKAVYIGRDLTVQGCHRIEKAGGEAAKTPVAEGGVLLLVDHVLQGEERTSGTMFIRGSRRESDASVQDSHQKTSQITDIKAPNRSRSSLTLRT